MIVRVLLLVALALIAGLPEGSALPLDVDLSAGTTEAASAGAARQPFPVRQQQGNTVTPRSMSIAQEVMKAGERAQRAGRKVDEARRALEKAERAQERLDRKYLQLVTQSIGSLQQKPASAGEEGNDHHAG